MSPAEIEKLKALDHEATPPPWEWVKRRARPDTIHGKRRPGEMPSELSTSHLLNVYGANGDPNGPATVAFRNALPRLLEERERLLEALRLTQWIEYDGGGERNCPICFGRQPKHKPACTAAAAIAFAEAPTSKEPPTT